MHGDHVIGSMHRRVLRAMRDEMNMCYGHVRTGCLLSNVSSPRPTQ
uniref:Uncharacterized protein n=1 Tax=Peronospora matthiolae TaxID=2874970 RepID=A0AAV1TFA0_9STRA